MMGVDCWRKELAEFPQRAGCGQLPDREDRVGVSCSPLARKAGIPGSAIGP